MSYWNHCTLVLHPAFQGMEEWMRSLPERFDREEGTLVHNGRNQLRRLT